MCVCELGGKMEGRYLVWHPSPHPSTPIHQVSRRLTRRIKKALHEHALGDVKVAVHAYKHLLRESTAQDCSYTFRYFSKELVQQPNVVVSSACVENSRTGLGALRGSSQGYLPTL